MSLTFRDGTFLRHGMEVSPKVAVEFRREADKLANNVLDRFLIKRYALTDSRLPQILDPHQREGVTFALTRSACYLAHAPGAGKTLEALTVGQQVFDKPFRSQVLLIVPPTLTKNWEREILKWEQARWPSIYIVGQTEQAQNCDWFADYVIVPDSMLCKPWVYSELAFRKWKVIAVDEASRFKEVSSQRTIALFGGRVGAYHACHHYSGLTHSAKHFILLDGSPMMNRPMELWAPIRALSWESIDFMSEHEFGVRYCGGRWNEETYEWEYRGANNLDELRLRLKDFMHVVGEERLGHPERLRSMLFMEPQRALTLKAWEQKNLKSTIDPDEKKSLGELASHRKAIGLSKVDWVVKYVRERLETNHESLLVFA